MSKRFKETNCLMSFVCDTLSYSLDSYYGHWCMSLIFLWRILVSLRFSCIGDLEVIEWAQLLSLKWCSRFMYFEVLGPVWYTHLNTCFQFFNNITLISTDFFIYTYFLTCFQTHVFSFLVHVPNTSLIVEKSIIKFSVISHMRLKFQW